jgi:hypothetical protein
MNMIGHAAYLECCHFILPCDAAQEWPKPITKCRLDLRPPFFGAEDAMIIRADVRHVKIKQRFETGAIRN